MLSWWKKKVSNGLKSASQNEHYTTAKRSYSISSTISATASTIRTDKELSSTGELDKFDRDKSKIQDKSVTQCIKTFINWYVINCAQRTLLRGFKCEEIVHHMMAGIKND